jgi:hypothetical protein
MRTSNRTQKPISSYIIVFTKMNAFFGTFYEGIGRLYRANDVPAEIQIGHLTHS